MRQHPLPLPYSSRYILFRAVCDKTAPTPRGKFARDAAKYRRAITDPDTGKLVSLAHPRMRTPARRALLEDHAQRMGQWYENRYPKPTRGVILTGPEGQMTSVYVDKNGVPVVKEYKAVWIPDSAPLSLATKDARELLKILEATPAVSSYVSALLYALGKVPAESTRMTIAARTVKGILTIPDLPEYLQDALKAALQP